MSKQIIMTSRAPLSPFKLLSFGITTIVLTLALIEFGSWLLLTGFDAKLHGGYNRVASGYSVFVTTPHFTFLTSKTEPSQVDVSTDEYGFVHDTPIALEKPDNTVRIFLNGGSALFGAGQARVYGPARSFPNAMYSYPDSIAGQLKKYLKAQRPDLEFEVVNAAAYTKRMHQSVMDYLSTISRLSPDFVINMDGYNDLNAFVPGTPYADLNEDLMLYVGLDLPPTLPESLYFYQVMKRVVDKLIVKPFDTGLGVRVENVPPEVALPRADYLEKKPIFVSNAERFLEILDLYLAVLREDEVEHLFVLQPMVDRGENKALTASEKAWQSYVATFKDEHHDYRLILRYFFDDYLSDAVERHVERGGYSYLDMGLRTRDLGDDFQLFTDYCHISREGNTFVAEQMGEFVLSKLDEIEPTSIRRAAARARESGTRG